MRGWVVAALLLAAVDANHNHGLTNPDAPLGLKCLHDPGPSLYCTWDSQELKQFGISAATPAAMRTHGYNIYFKENMNIETKWQFSEKKDLTGQEYDQEYKQNAQIIGLHYGTEYTIQVFAFNHLFYSKQDGMTLDIRTPKGPSGDVVTGVTAVETDSGKTTWNKIDIRWDVPEPPVINKVAGYKLRVERAIDGEVVYENYHHGNKSGNNGRTGEIVHDIFERKVYYKAFVMIKLKSDKMGPCSEPAWFILNPKPPTATPKDLKCQQYGGKNIKCDWSKISVPTNADDVGEKGEIDAIITYKVSMYIADGNNIVAKREVPHQDSPIARFKDLDLHVKYRFTIAACSQYDCGLHSPDFFYTTHGAPNAAPMNVTVGFTEKNMARYLNIEWKAPQRDDSIGKYRGFYISIEVGPYKRFLVQEIGGWKKSTTWNLNQAPKQGKGMVFSASVAAYNAHPGPFSRPARILNLVDCPLVCPPNWVRYGDMCYKQFHKHNLTFDEAKFTCANHYDSLLALPKSEKEARFMLDLWKHTNMDGTFVFPPIMLNMNKRRNPSSAGPWWGEDGREVTWTHWYNEPDRCTEGYTEHDNFCYKVFKDPMIWDDARETCLADGGELATARDEATNEFLTKLMLADTVERCDAASLDKADLKEARKNCKNKNDTGYIGFFWLNALRDVDEGKWAWQDMAGGPVMADEFGQEKLQDYSLMYDQDHNAMIDKNCLILRQNGGWKPYWCIEANTVICRKPSIGCTDKIPCTADMCDPTKYGLIAVEKCAATCHKTTGCVKNPGPFQDPTPMLMDPNKNCAFLYKNSWFKNGGKHKIFYQAEMFAEHCISNLGGPVGYVCTKPPSPGCPDGFTEVKSGCYIFNTQPMKHSYALHQCEQHQMAGLLNIESQVEEEAIEKYLEEHYPNVEFWRLGLTRGGWPPSDIPWTEWTWTTQTEKGRKLRKKDYSKWQNNDGQKPTTPNAILKRYKNLWFWAGIWWDQYVPFICEQRKNYSMLAQGLIPIHG